MDVLDNGESNGQEWQQCHASSNNPWVGQARASSNLATSIECIAMVKI